MEEHLSADAGLAVFNGIDESATIGLSLSSCLRLPGIMVTSKEAKAFGFRPLIDTHAAGINPDDGFFPVQNFSGLSDVMVIGSGINDRLHAPCGQPR